jgi:hypothetical protein
VQTDTLSAALCRRDVLTAFRDARILTDSVTIRRFAAKIDATGEVPPDTTLGPCWPWTGALNSDGYGVFRVGPDRLVRAHVYAFEIVHGPVPPGHELDHLCHDWQTCVRTDRPDPHRACASPWHVRAVRHAENVARSAAPTAVNARKTRCPLGHQLAGSNLYVHPGSARRECLICKRLRGRGLVAAVSAETQAGIVRARQLGAARTVREVPPTAGARS